MELFSLAPYRGLSLCAAVSGGRDSVALLHFLHRHAEEAHITLTALTCDHGIRAVQKGGKVFRDFDAERTDTRNRARVKSEKLGAGAFRRAL